MTTPMASKPAYVAIGNTRRLSGTLRLPSSKSTSTRALLTAALAPGCSRIMNLATGLNAMAMKVNVELLGAKFENHGTATIVEGVDIREIDRKVTFDPGNSGVVLRLLMGISGYLPHTEFASEYHSSLGIRSQEEMVSALHKLGVRCIASGQDCRLPISIRSSRTLGPSTEVSCNKSSQFLSGLLYLGAVSNTDLEIQVVDRITAPSMVHTTINNLRQAGIVIEYDQAFRRFFVKGDSQLTAADFTVGADPASTAAVLSLCASLDSDVSFTGFFEEELGNGAVIDYLINSGAEIEHLSENRINVKGGSAIRARDFDGALAPDAVPALAARAAFADGTSTFYNIEHIRYKESDRISDFRRELEKIGVRSDEKLDQLIIHGNPSGYFGGVVVDGHYDRGLIMALTTIGLHCTRPVLIREPFHVGQTYPEYFTDIDSLGANVKSLMTPGEALQSPAATQAYTQ